MAVWPKRQQNGEEDSSVVVHSRTPTAEDHTAKQQHTSRISTVSQGCVVVQYPYFTTLQPSVVFVGKKADPRNITTMHFDLPLR
jgi:hypothetical protein